MISGIVCKLMKVGNCLQFKFKSDTINDEGVKARKGYYKKSLKESNRKTISYPKGLFGNRLSRFL